MFQCKTLKKIGTLKRKCLLFLRMLNKVKHFIFIYSFVCLFIILKYLAKKGKKVIQTEATLICGDNNTHRK